MKRQRFYYFKTSSGEVKYLTMSEAREIDDPAIKARIVEIIANSKMKRMIKDGFEPGWQENIKAYAGGRREYDKLIKEMGLTEIGYDYVPTESNPDVHPCANEDFVKTAIAAGIDLNDTEAEAIKSGEYFKDE